MKVIKKFLTFILIFIFFIACLLYKTTLENNENFSATKIDETQTPYEDSTKKLPIEKISILEDVEQAIVITSDSFDSISANIETFEKTNGKWQQAFSPIQGVIGFNGFSYDKVEGDGKTPIGIFTLGTGFGKNDNPGTAMPYKQIDDNDYWIDDSESELYNTWQVGPSDGRWNSAEKLLRNDDLYNYALSINYNLERTPWKGSAIFMHVWRSPEKGTAGCIATSEDNLLQLIQWLDPYKNPIIIQGPISEILEMQ
jgi:L,D-peptidoglycan transpeptidase YkuD (ErfK/YbiS/YcfS/YnhG family)